MPTKKSSFDEIYNDRKEAVIILKNDEIEYINPKYKEIYSHKRPSEVIPNELISRSGDEFSAACYANGAVTIIKRTAKENLKIFELKVIEKRYEVTSVPKATGSMRNAMFTMRLTAEKLFDKEVIGNKEGENAVYSNLFYHNYYMLLHAIDNINMASDLYRKTIFFEPAYQEMCSFCRDLALSVNSIMRESSVLIEFSSDIDRAIIQIDAKLMEVALLNLITNAAASTGSDNKVLIQVKDGESSMSVSVSDTGEGINLDYLELSLRGALIDNAFEASCKTGLGLYIVHGIMELHDGIFLIENTGEGARATLIIPKEMSKIAKIRTTELEYRSDTYENILVALASISNNKNYDLPINVD
ncbi:hypothetical protein LJC01_00975 [Clostridiaceae bacterium OttesenSCG-928-D20]|nr:hypothetical protein [Clostridiaceae bacterium OttesenSCG-928-D20]